MKLPDYFESLSGPDREAYAGRAGTTVNYLRSHLICTPPRKTPRLKLLKNLAVASEGKVSEAEVFEHFFSTTAT